MRCPICKRGALSAIDTSPTLKTLICGSCSKIVQMKTKGGKVLEVIAPSMGIIAGTIAILGFLGIHNIDELNDFLDSL